MTVSLLSWPCPPESCDSMKRGALALFFKIYFLILHHCSVSEDARISFPIKIIKEPPKTNGYKCTHLKASQEQSQQMRHLLQQMHEDQQRHREETERKDQVFVVRG